jgi:pyrroline-5-carboxylate reductase
MNAMIQASRQLGFNAAQAELLVSQTFKGAIDLFQQADFTCEEWIHRVASKGGTTEAALRSYTQNELYTDIIAGAEAAFQRAKELGNR